MIILSNKTNKTQKILYYYYYQIIISHSIQENNQLVATFTFFFLHNNFQIQSVLGISYFVKTIARLKIKKIIQINPRKTLFSQEISIKPISKYKNKLKLNAVKIPSICKNIILSDLEHYLYFYIKQHQLILLKDINKHYKIYQFQNSINTVWKNIVLQISKIINFISSFSSFAFTLLQIAAPNKLNDFNKKLIHMKNIKEAKKVVKILLKFSI
ncbi:unnamed protein product [Paramecium pentaurelia]|uniref:Uncharacterized protein n=1 Tax=Paramecium pentaurelia TaxID=43138 RepID=A0A8S1V1P9_9CILI|nr:unnamed protein product [Paramecium pentaurelia]